MIFQPEEKNSQLKQTNAQAIKTCNESFNRKPHTLASLNFDPVNDSCAHGPMKDRNQQQKSPFEKNRHYSVGNSVKLGPENFSYGLRRIKHMTPSRDAVVQDTKGMTRKNDSRN